jgi:16S rRNA (guanine527-N7)-methyltransferase
MDNHLAPLPTIETRSRTLLESGLATLGITTDHAQQEQLLRFAATLEQWNRAFNLTAVQGVHNMVVRHLLDSLAILPFLHGTRIIDVGTGAGLPGIPLSIVAVNKQFFLLDSNQKKQIFVSHAAKFLGLKNVECVHSTAQTYQPAQKFSTILSRAFAPLDRLIPQTAHLLAENGRFLAMMGKMQEPLLLPTGYALEQKVILAVPGEKAERHLAIITKETIS